MSQSAQESRQYYVGVEGSQEGPFSEAQLSDMIRQGTVQGDTLVWYEGLQEWEMLDTLAIFSEAKSKGPASQSVMEVPPKSAVREVLEDGPQPPPPQQASQISNKEDMGRGHAPFTFAEGREAGQPVFSPEESQFGGQAFRKSSVLMAGGACAAVILCVGAFYFYANRAEDIERLARNKKSPTTEELRTIQLRQIVSELLIKPQDKVPALVKLVKENPNDAPGREGLQTAVEYYAQVQRGEEAGDLLMAVKRPADAIPYFLGDNPAYGKAEAAYFEAYKLGAGESAKKFLIEDINLLLGPLSNVPLAIERVKLLESRFPGQPHPFAYYLKSTDEQIADLFSRISFHFVQKLLTYVAQELPQIVLMQRPLVEIQRESNGMYRIVGTYSGPVALNKDRLPNIKFIFWYRGEKWAIVETNLTPERAKFAKVERKSALTDVLTSSAVLTQLENVFRTQFPRKGLHESVQ